MSIHRSFRLGSLVLLGGVAATLVATAQRTPKPTRTFDEKSGVIEMKMSMMGMEPTMTTYFDDYGAKTSVIVRMEVMGQTVVQHSISTGNVTVQWDDQTMQGTRTTGRSGNQAALTEYMQMDAARRKRLNYTELEQKEVLGKVASGFSVDTGGVTIKIWHWRNIPVYMEAETQGQTAFFEATRIDVPSTVDPSVFVVPKDVAIETTPSTPPSSPRRRSRR